MYYYYYVDSDAQERRISATQICLAGEATQNDAGGHKPMELHAKGDDAGQKLQPHAKSQTTGYQSALGTV
jgi:hypothetical protein